MTAPNTPNLTPAAKVFYTEALTENPFRWAQTSINEIDQLVSAGSHDVYETPSGDKVDPDEIVATSRLFLEGQIILFSELNLEPPTEFLTTIALADAFLREATPAK
jgi:hypothetical protein